MTQKEFATTSKDGTRIGAVVSGQGPALLLVHGTTADHTRWLPVLKPLEERFTVYEMFLEKVLAFAP